MACRLNQVGELDPMTSRPIRQPTYCCWPSPVGECIIDDLDKLTPPTITRERSTLNITASWFYKITTSQKNVAIMNNNPSVIKVLCPICIYVGKEGNVFFISKINKIIVIREWGCETRWSSTIAMTSSSDIAITKLPNAGRFVII